jgi:hypothetical protein
MVGMILETAVQDTGALETANATTNSLTVAIGDGSDVDYFQTATQIAADGTEVFVQFTPVAAGTIAITPQTVAMTNNGGGPVQLVLTNATAAFTGSRLGQKYYSAAGVVVYTFTGAGLKGAGIPGDVMNAYTSGKLKVFWRELK